MPFVRKSNSQGSVLPTDTRNIFIGRTGELLFFVQNILKTEEPTHNIISIWGQGGVGKSTLLSRFIDEVHSADFQAYCLTAKVDELQTTPVGLMEKFANQLHMQGAFEKALKQYKEASRKMQVEMETLQHTLVQRLPTVASATLEGVPFAGPLLREGAKLTAEHLLDRYQDVQRRKDEALLEEPIYELTRAFVEELNRLATTHVSPISRQIKYQRVILFFDTFEQLSAEAVPWLLDYFLQADIKSNVVLVIAGRDPIERSIPDTIKRWLPYYDNETIYSIPLNSFTEDETRSYLIKRGIADPDRITTIWQLSQGLPLYLSLLTSNQYGNVDPTADVVANFLRWIPQQEQIKRQLALDAAPFSRPFNQDDLAAFAYLPEDKLDSLYHWLIGQPFVRSTDGRNTYHDLAQELFSRHLYQRSKKAYYATRRALANHYQRLIEEIQEEEGQEAYHSSDWIELKLARAYQWFLLQDRVSHIKAMKEVLSIFQHVETEHTGEIVRALRDLSKEQLNNGSRDMVKQLSHFIEANLAGHLQELFIAANDLLETLAQDSSFPADLLASIYLKRGWSYAFFKKHQEAIADFNHALALNPNDATAYNNRGWIYWRLYQYQKAISDFNHALKLSPNLPGAYNGRGWAYAKLKDYQRAISDFDRSLELVPNNLSAYTGRGWAYGKLKDYQKTSSNFERILAIEPKNASDYFQHGLAYLWQKHIEQARVHFIRGWELYPTNVNYGWMAIWSEMCHERPDQTIVEQLETIASADPQCYEARICRGVALWLQGNADGSLKELEEAIQLDQDEWDSYFWKGMVYASWGLDEEAMAEIEKALEAALPPVLLIPLRWFKLDRPDFYQKYVMPLMIRYDLA